MEVREIKALLALMNEHGLVELEIEDKRGKVRLVRGTPSRMETNSVPHAAPILPVTVRAGKGSAVQPNSGDSSHGAAASIELAANQKVIESPMVGTFYSSPSPDAPPFVEEGSSVRKGQTVCIVEAMKMMNEIETPTAGRIVRILVENSQPVEYGQALMVVEVG